MRICIALAMCVAAGGVMADTPKGSPGALLFPNSDFELGTLENWRMDGDAFRNQPTRGDNVKARNKERSANHEGKWWVGTYENYQGADGQKAGKNQGDKPMGGLISTGFIIQRPFITFLLGGGAAPKAEVQLIVGGNVVRQSSGKDAPGMERVIWDAREYLNQKAMIHIVDKSKKAFGFVSADDFRYYETGASRLLFPNSDFEACDLSGWEAAGNAFAAQPVKGDNVTVRTDGKKTANQQGMCWIGTLEKFNGQPGQKPGDVQGDDPTGILRSQPFTIDGEKILFRIGGGNGKNVGVRLMVGGQEVRVSRGQRRPKMTLAMWDVAKWKGLEAQIEIFDSATKSWGFVNADDFRYGGADAELPVVPGAATETVTLPESLHNTAKPAAPKPAPEATAVKPEPMPEQEPPAETPVPAAPVAEPEPMPEEKPAATRPPAPKDTPAPEAATAAPEPMPEETPAETPPAPSAPETPAPPTATEDAPSESVGSDAADEESPAAQPTAPVEVADDQPTNPFAPKKD